MTFLSIFGVLILGLVVLMIGFVTKKLWLKLFSIIPLAISLVQIFLLWVMGK